MIVRSPTWIIVAAAVVAQVSGVTGDVLGIIVKVEQSISSGINVKRAFDEARASRESAKIAPKKVKQK